MTQREEQVKAYRKKQFQITLNYEQHLLLRWLIAEAFHDVREDKFNLEDLAEQIYECRIIDGKVHTFSDEKLKLRKVTDDMLKDLDKFEEALDEVSGEI